MSDLDRGIYMRILGFLKKKDDERKRLLEAQYAQGVKARIDVGVPKVDERGFQANVRDKC